MGVDYSLEQKELIESSPSILRKVVLAYSGCGKSTTCIGLAENRADKRVLYLSFNRSVAEEAKRKFPKEVQCLTMNSLAYKAVGKEFADRLQPSIDSVEFVGAIPNTRGMCKSEKLALAYYAMKTFSNWCASSDRVANHSHIPEQAMEAIEFGTLDPDQVIEGATAIFMSMLTESNTPISHDFYLKLFELKRPKLPFDVIIVDEAQDLNPVLLSILDLQEHAEIIKVGDPHQSIYAFRGAVDGLNDPDAHQYSLTTTYRFGQNLADLATAILMGRKNARLPLIGKGREVIIDDIEKLEEQRSAFDCALPLNITRTKAGLLGIVIPWILPSAKELSEGLVPHKKSPGDIRIFMPGGAKNYGLKELSDLAHLCTTGESRGAASAYSSWDEYLAFSEATACPSVLANVGLIKKYGGLIKSAAFKVTNQEVGKMMKADLAITTAHKSKGLEADYVMLHDDFPNFEDPEGGAIGEQEVNLLYVAGTRAKRALLTNNSFKQLVSKKELPRYKKTA